MKRQRSGILLLVGVFLLLAATLSFAQENELLLFEDIPIVVTSATGREQQTHELSNAMYVITADDIKNSGARQLTDLFIRVPGMQIREEDSQRAFVGIRDKAGIYTNNLLVLIDDVIVFNPTFGGVYWSALPVQLDEIERIEIIRGPGGVLYSSYAVNGVINIITKRSDSPGNGYVHVKAGTQTSQQETIAASQKSSDGKHAVRAVYQFDNNEGWNKKYATGKMLNYIKRHTVGVRSDNTLDESSTLTAFARYQDQVGYAKASLSAERKRPAYIGIASIMYNKIVSENYDFKIDVDCSTHDAQSITPSDLNALTPSIVTQHNIKYDLAGKHVLSLGGEYRYVFYDTAEYPTNTSGTVNSEQTQRIVSYFLQDEYRPTDKWILTAGTRVDHNNFIHSSKSPYLLSPRISAMYLLTETQRIRASVTRSYRTPIINDYDKVLYSGLIRGNADLEPERVWTYETGYQAEFFKNRFIIDTALYLSKLKDTAILGNTSGGVSRDENNGEFDVLGTEIFGTYRLTDKTSINFDYSYAQPKVHPDHPARQLQDRATQISKHTAGAGMLYKSGVWTFNTYAKYISSYEQGLNSLGTASSAVKMRSYIKTECRLARQLRLPWMKENDAEVELIARDYVGAHVYEAPNKYTREAEYYVGLKIDF